MTSFYLLFSAVSIIFGVISFLASNNLICGVAVGTFSLIYFLGFAISRMKKFSFKQNRFHLCYSFINTFIVTLSVKGTLGSSFEAATTMMDEDFKKIISGIEQLDVEERLKYLKRVFPFDIYSLFLNIIEMYGNQGGDIIAMSSYLTEESRGIEEYITQANGLIKKNVVEFSVLWLIALSILVVLRFALANFYSKITKNILFVVAIGLLFAFVLVSIEIFLRRSTNLEIKGWNDHEKYI